MEKSILKLQSYTESKKWNCAFIIEDKLNCHCVSYIHIYSFSRSSNVNYNTIHDNTDFFSKPESKVTEENRFI